MLSGDSERIFVLGEIVLGLKSDCVFSISSIRSVNGGDVNGSQTETSVLGFLSFLGGSGSRGQVFNIDVQLIGFISDESIVFSSLELGQVQRSNESVQEFAVLNVTS